MPAAILCVWGALWAFGGYALALGLFRLRRVESPMVGLGLGIVLQSWSANLLARVVPIPLAFWLAAALVFFGGLAAVLARRRFSLPRPSVSQLALLGGITLLFFAIGRGLGLFDDYQNLPTLSLMAAGDVPPHFALDPALRFGYHYLLLLFAAQAMRVGQILPWSALDLTRGLIMALPLILAGLWAFRITNRWLPAFLSSCAVAFAGGARWLLLLLPSPWLARISGEIILIGSAASSASDLAEAMISPWKIDGAGPLPFPFAFYSGINQPHVMGYTGIAGSGVLILLLLLLTAERWNGKGAIVVTGALIAALAIANEIAFLLLGLGLLVAATTALVAGRMAIARRKLVLVLVSAGAALAVAFFQGGMLTEIASSRLRHQAASSSYFDPTPMLVWPPAIVSAHLGALSLARPLQLLVALLEIGPVVLVTPLVISWGVRSWRLGKWIEAGVLASSLGVLLAAFFSFKGPLFTAAPRLMGGWLFVCALYFVPLAWIWAPRQADGVRIGAAAAGVISCVGGLILFAVQLAAVQKPIYATFISDLDAQMAERYWNRLEGEALVFDPLVFRAPTVFGRPTKSSPTWYTRSDEWVGLVERADPLVISRAGFSYMYFDSDFWESLSPEQQLTFQADCVRQIAQVDGIHGESDYTKDFRRLLDIRGCR